jgi:hypothetical protein
MANDRTQPEFSAGERIATLEATMLARETITTTLTTNLQEELDRRFRATEDLLATLAAERVRAIEKFEASVDYRFQSVNEFRKALDELSKQMATRRELENLIAGIKSENAVALSAANAVTGEHGKQIDILRSRLDVGPTELRTLAERSNLSLGAERRSQQVSAAVIGWAGVAVVLISVLVGVAIKLA